MYFNKIETIHFGKKATGETLDIQGISNNDNIYDTMLKRITNRSWEKLWLGASTFFNICHAATSTESICSFLN